MKRRLRQFFEIVNESGDTLDKAAGVSLPIANLCRIGRVLVELRSDLSIELSYRPAVS